MKIHICGALTGAALLALSASTAAYAQLSPVVATITVPVTITNLDAEWAKGSFGAISVACDVSAELQGSGKVLAEGAQPIPFVETPATSTVRAMLNFAGSVVVQTYAPKAAVNEQTGDAETAAQRAAAKAIKDAKSYVCYFKPTKTRPGGTRSGSDDPSKMMESLLSKGYERGDGAEKSSTYIVTGSFTSGPKK